MVTATESALCIRWPKSKLQLQHQFFQWIFRTDFLEDWLVWSVCSSRDLQEPSPTPQFKSISSSVLSLLCGSTLTSVCDYWKNHSFDSVQFGLVAQLCPILCNPMNHSTLGLPVHHPLPEFTQTHVHWVGGAIQPSHRLSSPPLPALNLFSSILGTYRPREFIFPCPIFLPIHTVDGVLKARTLKWFAIAFSSGPHSVRPRHHDLSILGGPTWHCLVSLS